MRVKKYWLLLVGFFCLTGALEQGHASYVTDWDGKNAEWFPGDFFQMWGPHLVGQGLPVLAYAPVAWMAIQEQTAPYSAPVKALTCLGSSAMWVGGHLLRGMTDGDYILTLSGKKNPTIWPTTDTTALKEGFLRLEYLPCYLGSAIDLFWFVAEMTSDSASEVLPPLRAACALASLTCKYWDIKLILGVQRPLIQMAEEREALKAPRH